MKPRIEIADSSGTVTRPDLAGARFRLGLVKGRLYAAAMTPALLTHWIEPGLAWLYPEVCQLCETERATPAGGFVCSKCYSQVRFIKPPYCERCGLPFAGAINTAFECSNCQDMELRFASARSAVTAKGVVLEVIHRYKYSHALWFEAFLADLLLREALPALRGEKWDLVVPVPLHPTRQREREFNQAERLGRPLARALGIPLRTNLVRRVLPTRTQTQLTKGQRAENVRRAFAARPHRRLQGERVILVDDVLTTGATTSACAGVLQAAGAGEVCVWTVARGV